MTNQEIVKQPYLRLADIMEITKSCRTTASKIKSVATKQYNGYVPFNSHLVKTKAVLAALGLNEQLKPI